MCVHIYHLNLNLNQKTKPAHIDSLDKTFSSLSLSKLLWCLCLIVTIIEISKVDGEDARKLRLPAQIVSGRGPMKVASHSLLDLFEGPTSLLPPFENQIFHSDIDIFCTLNQLNF